MSGLDVITFGCRLNAQESAALRERAVAAEIIDTVVVNTCAVTAEAMRQARQSIRKVRRARPGTRIVVTGCAAQIDPASFAAMPEVDHVLGNAEKLSPAVLRTLAIGGMERIRVNDIFSVRETAGHLAEGFGDRARAYVQIQNGCDHRCTFCVIPFGRGASRSVPAGEVVRQIRLLVEGGYREVVLTGVDLTAYGADLPGRMRFGDLVQKILRLVPELPRLRLSSIDSIETDEALFESFADARLMPHLHLSLQAGHDIILKRMKRRHRRADAIDFCQRVRGLRSDMVFGADFITGFPTETEAMFAATLSLVDALDLTFLHVFPFSPRPGTPAARMPQVERQEIKQRAARLRAAGEAACRARMDALRGLETAVLLETETRGRTEQFFPIRLDVAGQPRDIVRARIAANDGLQLQGTVLS